MVRIDVHNIDATRYVTTSEAAKILRVTRHTVMNWCADGRLTACRTPGGNLLIPAETIEAFLNTPAHEEVNA